MNHGLISYSIFLILTATIIASLGNYDAINATSVDLYLHSSTSPQSNNKHDTKTYDHGSHSCSHCNDKQDNGNKDNDNINNDESKNTPLKLPFSSNFADQSGPKDYSNIIPFP